MPVGFHQHPRQFLAVTQSESACGSPRLFSTLPNTPVYVRLRISAFGGGYLCVGAEPRNRGQSKVSAEVPLEPCVPGSRGDKFDDRLLDLLVDGGK